MKNKIKQNVEQSCCLTLFDISRNNTHTQDNMQFLFFDELQNLSCLKLLLNSNCHSAPPSTIHIWMDGCMECNRAKIATTYKQIKIIKLKTVATRYVVLINVVVDWVLHFCLKKRVLYCSILFMKYCCMLLVIWLTIFVFPFKYLM